MYLSLLIMSVIAVQRRREVHVHCARKSPFLRVYIDRTDPGPLFLTHPNKHSGQLVPITSESTTKMASNNPRTPASQQLQVFRFLDLPPELRVLVYGYCAVLLTLRYTGRYSLRNITMRDSPLCFPLAQVNRVVRREFLDVIARQDFSHRVSIHSLSSYVQDTLMYHILDRGFIEIDLTGLVLVHGNRAAFDITSFL